MRIRLGILGLGGGRAARTRDEADFGGPVKWIEIDGHRYSEGCSDARVTFGSHAVSTAVVTLEGTVEVVTVGLDGEPLEYENQAALASPPGRCDKCGRASFDSVGSVCGKRQAGSRTRCGGQIVPVVASISIPTTARVPLDQTSEGLIMALQRLGNEYGPTGVAETAAQLVGRIPAGEAEAEPSAPVSPDQERRD